MAIGATRFFVSFFEHAATAIAAGVAVGGFGGATAGLVNGRSRKQVEGDALRNGYIGALFAISGWLVDQCIVYATSI